MSVAELKDKFRNIPGIENLTIRLEGGLEVYSLGGPFVSLAPLATDAEIEAALRSIVPTSASIAPVPFTSAPSITPPEAKAAMTTPSNIGFQPGEIASMFQALRDRRAAMIDGLKHEGASLAAILDAGERLHANFKAEGDALRAEFGQISNFPPKG